MFTVVAFKPRKRELTMADEKCPFCTGVVGRTDNVCPHCQRALTGKAMGQTILADGTGAISAPNDLQRVTVVDIDMPFASVITFMAKWALASIPAFLILFVLGLIVMAVVSGIR
jgi:hypothetical protein